jgi:hypothetical protein
METTAPSVRSASWEASSRSRPHLRRSQGQHRACPGASRHTEPQGPMRRHRQCRCRRADRLAAAMPVLWRKDDHHRDLRARWPRPRAAILGLRKQDRDAMPERHITAPRTHPLAAGRYRASASYRTHFDRSSTAAPSHAIFRRASSASRCRHPHPSGVSMRPQQPTRNPQIPIDPSRSRGFLPWRLPDAGPGATSPPVDGRHPKPFTPADLGSTKVERPVPAPKRPLRLGD